MSPQADVVGVDVLAVMDRSLARCEQAGGMRHARAAVAELIEACHERDKALSYYNAHASLYGDDSNKGPMREARGRAIRATKRYTAALAAVTPADGEGE